MAIKRWNASTSNWELVGTPGTASPSAIGAAGLVGGNTFSGNQIVSSNSYISVGDRSNIAISGATPLNGININNSSSRPRIGFFDSIGGDTTGSSLGTIEFFDYLKSGQAEKRSAVIEVIRDGSSATQRGGAIIFNTVPNASNSITERMRIESNGSVGVGSANTATFNPDSAYNKVIVLQQTDQALTFGSYWQAGVGQNSFINSSQGSSRSNASNLYFQTGALNRFLIEWNGNVQIVNNSVDTLRYFDIYNTSSGNSAGAIIRLITNNAANTAVTTVDIVKYRNGYLGILNNDASAVIGFGTGGTERMRIDSSGNVGIGNSSPDSPISILTSTLTTNKPALRISNTNTTGAFNWATSMINTAMTTGQNLIQIMGKVESARNSGYIGYRWVGDGSTSNAITFGHFAVDNVVNIDGNGYLLAGYLTSNGAYKLQVNSQIFATSSSIATSDGRYKENVLPITSGLDIIDSLNPVSFNWKEHPVHNFVPGKTVGFIAQEVQEALSEYDWADNIIKTNMTGAVLDEEGNEIIPAEEFLGIAESNIIPLLVAAVKELRAEVNTLKAQLSN